MAAAVTAVRPRVLAVVPARGGSKGVPRKNVRLLHGKPLIGHVLTTLRDSRFAPAVWVTTDDEEIGEIGARYGASVVKRPADLAGDMVTLDPVIEQAARAIEELTGERWDIVATVQPTSPLLTAARFDECIAAVAEQGFDSAITVVEDRHLRWSGTPERPAPAFDKRVNRQQLPPLFRETGAVLATRREFVQTTGRFGPRVRLVPLAEHESVDIDSNADWWLADNYLERRRIAFRVDGGGAIGLGHVYRVIMLCSRMFNHDIRLFMDPAYQPGMRLAQHFGLEVVPVNGASLVAELQAYAPDVVVLDVLDTTREYVERVRAACDFIVTFEDLGTGADASDLVFNELYADPKADGQRRFSGPSVACVREEFYSIVPRPTAETVRRVLVTFGGTDPNDLTIKSLDALDLVEGVFEIMVVLGLGYPDPSTVERRAQHLLHPASVHRNVRNMSTLMLAADLALTSAGRTVFELIACQTPLIALAQNARELSHTCIDPAHGVRSLGLGADTSIDRIAGAVREMLSYDVRTRAREQMAAVDLWHGPDRILSSILQGIRARLLQQQFLRGQHVAAAGVDS